MTPIRMVVAAFGLMPLLAPPVASFVSSTVEKNVLFDLCAAEQQIDDLSTDEMAIFQSGQALVVDQNIGSGSYGTVHLLGSKESQSSPTIFVGKHSRDF